MTVMQAAAVLTLWRSKKFDTFQIAYVLHLKESAVVRALDIVRNAERGIPEMYLEEA